MNATWLGERVAAPDVKLLTRNAILNKIAGNWGPNTTFRFPVRDGTGGIWKAVAKTIPKEKQLYGADKAVVKIDTAKKIAKLQDGRSI